MDLYFENFAEPPAPAPRQQVKRHVQSSRAKSGTTKKAKGVTSAVRHPAPKAKSVPAKAKSQPSKEKSVSTKGKKTEAKSVPTRHTSVAQSHALPVAPLLTPAKVNTPTHSFGAPAPLDPKQMPSKVTEKTLKAPAVKATTHLVSPTRSRKMVKETTAKKSFYTEESILKEPSWNIYTGNPGSYSAEGDTVAFGTVTALPDSTFLRAQRTTVSHSLKPYGRVGKERVAPHNDWSFALILLFWGLYAIVRVGFPSYINQVFSSVVKFGAATRLFRSRGYKMVYGAVWLDLLFSLILPFAVLQIGDFFKMGLGGYPGIVIYLGIMAVVNGFFWLKIMMYRFVGSIVMLKEQTEELIFNIRLYFKALGLILVPLVTLFAVIPITQMVTALIMAALTLLMYVAIVFRSIYLGHQKGISIFYLILYLCTLEILPILLIFKLVTPA